MLLLAGLLVITQGVERSGMLQATAQRLLGKVTDRPLTDVVTGLAWWGHFDAFRVGLVQLKHVTYFGLVTFIALFAATAAFTRSAVRERRTEAAGLVGDDRREVRIEGSGEQGRFAMPGVTPCDHGRVAEPLVASKKSPHGRCDRGPPGERS